MKEREERSRAGDTVILTCHWRKSKDVPRHTKPSPDQPPTRNPISGQKHSLITARQRKMGSLHKGQVLAFSPKTSSSIFIVLNIGVCCFFFSLKYVYTHTWLQRISDHNIITKRTNRKRKHKTLKLLHLGLHAITSLFIIKCN